MLLLYCVLFPWAQALDMTKDQAKQLVLNSIEASFADEARKQAMRTLLG